MNTASVTEKVRYETFRFVRKKKDLFYT